MPIITAKEINAIAFTEPIDLALINDDIIIAAEGKYLISAITKPILDDLSVHPGNYINLVDNYIKPYLAYCVKIVLYSQYINESSSDAINVQQRENIINEANLISQTKRTLLVNHIISGSYGLYVNPVKRRINGFLINNKK